jgi:hypothetical protein
VISAWILPRSRNSGRSTLKAQPIATAKIASATRIASVSCQLSQNSTPMPISALSTPPTSCTMPVPTRFRRPSASFMIREISTPVCVESK